VPAVRARAEELVAGVEAESGAGEEEDEEASVAEAGAADGASEWDTHSIATRAA